MTKFQNLIAQLDITRNITDEDIEKTITLLNLYGPTLRRAGRNIDELEEECFESRRQSVSDFINLAIDFDRDVIEKIRQARFNGFTHYMIVVAEGAGSASDIAAKIKEATDLDPRVTVLGHIQRGGTPTGRDRVNATKMGYLAVELLLQGKTNRIVCTHDGGYTDVDIDEGLSMQKGIQKMEVDVLAAMTGI